MTKQSQAGRRTGSAPPGRLRIVAGKWRRRLVPVAAIDGLRPTPSRVRETLFNWLSPHVDGARCLDLCAGSGALGFEALSRGAGAVTFIEKSPRAAAAIRDAMTTLGATNAALVVDDATHFLTVRTPEPVDIAFVDPPWAADLQAELCRLLADRGWLADGARIYLEQARDKPEPALPAGWHVTRDKTAGGVRYLLLAAHDEHPDHEGAAHDG